MPVPCADLLCKRCQADITVLTGPRCKCCGRPFISSSGIDHLCGTCLQRRPAFHAARSIFLFEKTVRILIHRFKYNGDLYALKALVRLSEECLGEETGGSGEDLPGCILPVPVYKSRLRKRGFNQSLVLASEIFKEVPVLPDVLIKTRPTPSQTGLSLKERQENVRGSFACRPITGQARDVIIFDDVFTTGATAAAAAGAAKKAGAENIAVLTLARTPAPW